MISVIITMYNNERFAHQCIQSVIAQTFENIEIIVVDDGSRDRTAKIIKEISENDGRIRYYFQENSGVSVARNRGIQESRGDFIMFVDGDDLLKDNIIDELYKNIDDETDIIACCCEGFNEKGSFANFFFSDSLTMRTTQEKEKLYLQLMKTEYGQPQENNKIFTAIGVPWGKLYRKTFLDKNNLRFDSSLRRMQDNIFNMHCFAKARTIKYLNQPLYMYRIDHITGLKLPPERYYQIIEERAIFLSNNPSLLTERIIEGKNNEVKDFFLTSIKVICNSYDYPEAKDLIIQLSRNRLYAELISDNAYTDKKFSIVKLFLTGRRLVVLYWIMRLRTLGRDSRVNK